MREKVYGLIQGLSGTYADQDFWIEPGQTVWMGRDSRIDIVLSGREIARLHCGISYDVQEDCFWVLSETEGGVYTETGFALPAGVEQKIYPGTEILIGRGRDRFLLLGEEDYGRGGNPHGKTKQIVAAVLAVIVLLAVCAAAIYGLKKTQNAQEEDTASLQAQADSAETSGESVQTQTDVAGDYESVLLSAEIGPPAEGSEAWMFTSNQGQTLYRYLMEDNYNQAFYQALTEKGIQLSWDEDAYQKLKTVIETGIEAYKTTEGESLHLSEEDYDTYPEAAAADQELKAGGEMYTYIVYIKEGGEEKGTQEEILEHALASAVEQMQFEDLSQYSEMAVLMTQYGFTGTSQTSGDYTYIALYLEMYFA